jgi:hypothetical protein
MICGFCGREIADEIVKNGCGGCPMSGGCRKVCCPHCGYENPAIPKLLQKLIKKKPNDIP